MTTIRKTAAIAALLLAAGIARAAPPKTITYSGFLLDSSGAPVGGSTLLTFNLYDAATNGNLVWGPEAIAVTPSPSDGYFSVTIGLTIFLPDLVFNNPVFLGVRAGSEAEMTPRIALGSVPSSFSAIAVDWTGVRNRPVSSCGGSTPYVTGVDQNGLVTCAAGPSGAAGCATGQVLKWTGSAWTCQADDNTTYSASAPLTLSGTTFSMVAAGATTSGYLSSTDWNTFNGKLATVAVAAPITGNGTGGAPLAIAAANGTTPGYLSAADWNTFNGKLGAVTTSAPLSGAGTGSSPLTIAAANSTTSGYLVSADWNVFNSKVTAVGVATNGGLVVSGSTNPALSLTTSCGDGQVLRWSATGSTWACATTTSGTVTSVGVTAPLTVATGTTTPLIGLPQATGSASGYLSSADWSAFNAKAGTASPTFTGTVTAPTFAGNLSGNATTATTASSANAVAANVITPSDLNTAVGPTAGQVPSRAASDTFTWVTPVTGVTAGTGITVSGAAPSPTVAVNTAAIQARVNWSCASGYAIRGINSDGTVTCEAITPTVTKRVSINPFGANLGGGAVFTYGFGAGGIVFPDTGTPMADFGFVVPDDAVTGTAISVEIVWRATNAGGTVLIRDNWASLGRVGASPTWFYLNPAATGQAVGSVALVQKATHVFNTTFQAGDAINYGIFRSTQDATNDSNTSSVQIYGISFLYSAYR